jgi:hypothetical protein
MAENAWLTFHCETDKQARVATFRHNGDEWQLTEIAADALPEGGAMPGRISMTGTFGFGEGYAGCPGCGAGGYARCGTCGELSCWRGATPDHTCPSCGNHQRIDGPIERADAMDVA